MGLRSVGGIACVMRNLAMWTVVPLMYILGLSHMDILSHTLTLLSELSGDLILAVFQYGFCNSLCSNAVYLSVNVSKS